VKLELTFEVAAPRERVWSALLDPDRLAAAIPGCEGLSEVEPGCYRVSVRVGVPGIRGTYAGEVRVLEAVAPEAYRLVGDAAGPGGKVRGDVRVSLEELDAGRTRLQVAGHLSFEGPMARLGEGMLLGAGRLLLGQFFGRLRAAAEGSEG
jgi:carbon monoxide dehydrogenase subunit G